MTQNSDPKLSVIIVNRNTSDLLINCIERIYDSDLEQVPEIIVVDNGSTDDSVKRVRNAYPGAIIIEAGRNLGFSAANNRALEKASGEFVLLVNTDALLEKDCAARLLNIMTNDPRAAMVGPQLLNEDGTHQTSFEAVPTLVTEILNRSLLKRLFPQKYPGKKANFSEPHPVEAVIGAVIMIRCSALEQLHGFDEDYFFFLEETDLAVRMRKAGWLVIHDPLAKAIHLQGATAKKNEAAARIEFYRSRYIFFRKHYGILAMRILKAVLTINLTLNIALLGAGTIFTLGMMQDLKTRFKVRTKLWIWHILGCPEGWGLPRG